MPKHQAVADNANTVIELTEREKTILGVILEAVAKNAPVVSTHYDEDANIWITEVNGDSLAGSLQLLATTVANALYSALERRTPPELFGIGWVWNADRSSGELRVENSANRLLRNLLDISFKRRVMRMGTPTQDEAAQAETGEAPGTKRHEDALAQIKQDDQDVMKLIRKINNVL